MAEKAQEGGGGVASSANGAMALLMAKHNTANKPLRHPNLEQLLDNLDVSHDGCLHQPGNFVLVLRVHVRTLRKGTQKQ